MKYIATKQDNYMKTEYINKFINITKNTHNEMMKKTISEETPVISSLGDNSENTYYVSVKYDGDIKGSIVLTLNKESAMDFTKTFIDESNVEENDIKEVLGEFINKIANTSKEHFQYDNIELSKESFSKDKVDLVENVSYIEVPFKTDKNSFSIIMGLEDF